MSETLPDDIDVRIERRDVDPLPAGAILRFQVINRGKDPTDNYRWLLFEDGRWFLSCHSPDDSDWRTPFDTDWPPDYHCIIPAGVLTTLRQQINLDNQPTYQADLTVEGGGIYVITTPTHEVIYEAYEPPLVELLESVAQQFS